MPFDPLELPQTLEPVAAVNGALYERLYRRYREKWYSLFCRHRAFKVYADDPFPTDPAGEESGVFQIWMLKNSTDRLLLITSKCLVCHDILLEGRLQKPDGSVTSVGTLYVLGKDKSRPPIKDIPEEILLKFYEKEWEFITSLLADFNKLTIAIAVAAAVFFEKFPSVFYTFVAACFILIALYAASYIAQKQIARKYYRDAGKTLKPAYRSFFDSASLLLQGIFAIAIVVVLCAMIRAERISMRKVEENSGVEKTRPYNPATQTQDTRPFIPPRVEPNNPAQTPQIQPEKSQTPQTPPQKTK
jgi:hypothetical protein